MAEGKHTLPATIRIADRFYRIEIWDSRLAVAAARHGECDKINRIIRVDCQYGEYQTAATLLHEALHGIYKEYRLEDDDGEERTVGTLETALMQVFLDNPDLLKLIFKAIKNQRVISS